MILAVLLACSAGSSRAQEPVQTDVIADTITGQLEPGRVVSGELTEGSPVLPDRLTYFHAYEYTPSERVTAVLTLQSPVLDPLLQIRTEAGEILAINDDDPSALDFTLNSRLAYTFEPGTSYVIVATTYDPATGPYELHMTQARTVGGQEVSEVDWLSVWREERNQLSVVRGLKCTSTDGSIRLMPTADVDHFHPAYFTRVSEESENGERYIIHQPTRGGGDSVSRAPFGSVDNGPADRTGPPTLEVDRESTITIDFDYGWLQEMARTGLGASIMIRAQVVGPEGSRNAEVPGYWVTGEQARRASARILTSNQARTLICPPIQRWGEEGIGLLAALELGDPAVAAKIGARELRKAAPVLGVSLQKLTSTASTDNLRAAARAAAEDMDVIRELGRALQQELDEVDAEDSISIPTLRRIAALWQGLARSLSNIGEALDSFDEDPRRFVTGLKATRISVTETGAKPGERLVIRIENDAEQDSLPRVLPISLVVRDFGLNSQITDAVLLLRRTGVSAVSNDALVSSLVEDGAEETTVPLPVNFAPVAGATLGWNWYPRDVGKSEGWTEFFRWLNPGVGVNVSFPRFGEKIVRVTDEGDDDTAPSFEVEEITDEIDIGAGIVFSLFGNSVQASVGWNLTTPEKRAYWALGFSFAQIAGGVSGGDKEAGGDGG